MANSSSTHAGTMIVLDIDGVLTDPETGEVSTPVLGAVISDLNRGVPVAFNTGRALAWVEERVWPALKAACAPTALDNLLIVAEKGSVLGEVEHGELRPHIDSSLAPPAAFRRAVRMLVERQAFAGAMFWDAAKLTMVSIERRPDVTLAQFEAARARLVPELELLLAEHGLRAFKIENTVIATDVEHERAGKHLGAEQILKWLEDQGSAPSTFTAIGDSASDARMADVFAHTAPTTFVFVGDPARYTRPAEAKYDAVMTGGGYSQAAAAYLSNT